MIMKLDGIDLKILKILQAKGRITNSDLAKQVGLSPPPVLKRIKKLEKSRIIKSYVALVDPLAVGIETLTFVEVVLNWHKKDMVTQFINEIRKIDEVLECHHITGSADFLLKIAVKNIPAYEELVLNKLLDLPSIQHLRTMVVLSTPKSNTALNLKEAEKNGELNRRISDQKIFMKEET
jgi:Lrp/AsnC family leucine-responsive transcriptional regulator